MREGNAQITGKGITRKHYLIDYNDLVNELMVIPGAQVTEAKQSKNLQSKIPAIANYALEEDSETESEEVPEPILELPARQACYTRL